MTVSLDDVSLSVRLYNVLRQEQIKTLDELTGLTERELMRWPNFGNVCLNELKSVMSEHKLALDTSSRAGRVYQTKTDKLRKQLAIARNALFIALEILDGR
jgi:DNA-directed RNA polymerase alpha subunit